ncbi:MAG: O-antigen ligase family protein [Flavobacteriales bacterium]|nr:O-antigen ligase family protein [Flavobacteriales bacterium]
MIVPLFVAIIIGSNSDNLIFRDLNNIGLISLALFILLTCMSVVKEKYFYIILPFMLLAFPSIINRFFPGVFFGFQGEEIIPSPIFTWLDVYLFSIISYYIFIKKKRFKATLMDNKIVFVVFVLISISYVINLLFSKSINDFLISVSFSFQLRYLAWIFLLFSIFDFRKHQKEILIGLTISVVFLLLESSVNTYTKNLYRLTSGSLQLNSFGNIIASISGFFYLVLTNNKFKRPLQILLIIGVIVGVGIVIATANRSSNIVSLVGFILLNLILLKKIKYVIPNITGAVALIVFKFLFMFGIISFGLGFGGEEDAIVKGQSSIKTRFELWEASSKMIEDNPVFGLGPGRFNSYKNEYGVVYKVLLNQHNGFLSLINAHGISGIALYLFIYLYPIYLFFRSKKNEDYLVLLFSINFIMIFCDLTSSGIEKQSIFSLLAFNAFYVISTYYYASLDDKKLDPSIIKSN